MALTIKDPKPAKDDTPAVTEPKTVDLELRAYNRYVRNDVLYEKGQAYRFTQDQAEVLLEEVDDVNGRPIWGRWKPVSKRMVVEREVTPKDMTWDSITPAPVADEVATKGIDIGDDSEIADLLKDDSGDQGHEV